MSLPDIEIALQTALNQISPALSTARPNEDFEPTGNAPYQRVEFLSTVDPTEFTRGYREIGYMQVTLMYPLGSGNGDSISRAKLIRDTFKIGNAYISNSTKVVIDKTADILNGRRDGHRWATPVRVYFFTNILE